MDFYFAELGYALLAGFALVMHGILFLVGFAAIVALSRRVAKFVIVDLSPGKHKLALMALIAVDIVLVIAAIAAAVSQLR
jgi:hypothetical protein